MAKATDELMAAIGQASRETGVPKTDILQPQRQQTIAAARYRAMLLLRQQRWTIADIAEAFETTKMTVRLGLKRAAQPSDPDSSMVSGG
jgi:chromosomal replication initiation ATPase DnaA